MCDGSAGNINYTLYDLSGKLVLQGETRKDVDNLFLNIIGAYFLKIRDVVCNCKFFLF